MTETRWSGESAFDREMNAALAEDAAKLEAMGQDPGPTLEDLDDIALALSQEEAR